jgi:hypothetical protein
MSRIEPDLKMEGTSHTATGLKAIIISIPDRRVIHTTTKTVAMESPWLLPQIPNSYAAIEAPQRADCGQNAAT